jgi:hypothetical protein
MPSDTGLSALGPHIGSVIAALAVVTVLLILRNRRPRRLRLDRLWVRPVLAVILIGGSLFRSPPPFTAASVIIMLLALAVGAALGWQRGRLTQIEVDPVTHTVTAKVSAVGVILVLGLIMAKFLLRSTVLAPGPSGFLSTATLTDALLLLSVATMGVQQIEISIRVRRLHSAAVAASGGAVT